MHRVGQAWLVLDLTGDAAMLGVATGLQFLPMLLLGPFGGVLADRVDRRRLMIIAQTALAVQALLLGVLVLAGMATAPLVLGAALVLGIVTAIDAPARQTIVSDLVPARLVVNAVSLNSASFNAARLIGPALAGLIIAAWGTGWVFVVNALTFGTMLVALWGIRLRGKRPVRGRGGVRQGMSHVRRRPDLLFVIALAGLVSMFALNFQMTIALMSTQEFDAGAVTYGVLGSVMAVGSLAGSLLAARRGSTSLRIISVAALALSVSTLAAGLMPGSAMFGVALVACGLSALTMMTSANSYLQTHAGEEHRSRVMALYLAVFFGTTPVGAPIIGWVAGALGPRAALVIPGLLALVTTIGLLLLYRRSVSEPGRADAPATPPVRRVRHRLVEGKLAGRVADADPQLRPVALGGDQVHGPGPARDPHVTDLLTGQDGEADRQRGRGRCPDRSREVVAQP